MRPSDLRPLLVSAFRNGLKILIKGAPGVGKSDLVESAAREAGCDLQISHPAVSDPTDYKGMPAILADGTAHFLPFGDLNELITAQAPRVAFADDLGQAPHGVQAAFMQLLLARQVNGHKLSPHVVFCGATNDSSHRAGVHSILEPVKSRWDTIIELTVDREDWIGWALNADLAEEVIAFINFRPDFLTKFEATRELTNTPSPRTIANVAKWVKAGVTSREVIAGAAGEGFAAEFLGFLRVYQSLPSIEQILLDPTRAPVPTEASALFAIGTALVKRTTKDNAARIFTYLSRIPKEFEVSAVRDLTRHKQEIVNTKPYQEWALRNTAILQ